MFVSVSKRQAARAACNAKEEPCGSPFVDCNFRRVSFIDLENAAFDFLTVETLDRGVGFVSAAELHEAETLRLSGRPVLGNAGGVSFPKRNNEIVELRVGHGFREISQIDLHCELLAQVRRLPVGLARRRRAPAENQYVEKIS
jgi:hypothetical protein